MLVSGEVTWFEFEFKCFLAKSSSIMCGCPCWLVPNLVPNKTCKKLKGIKGKECESMSPCPI